MNIIIAGDGKVGSTLTRLLSAEGHDITLIDTNFRLWKQVRSSMMSWQFRATVLLWIFCCRQV